MSWNTSNGTDLAKVVLPPALESLYVTHCCSSPHVVIAPLTLCIADAHSYVDRMYGIEPSDPDANSSFKVYGIDFPSTLTSLG